MFLFTVVLLILLSVDSFVCFSYFFFFNFAPFFFFLSVLILCGFVSYKTFATILRLTLYRRFFVFLRRNFDYVGHFYKFNSRFCSLTLV